MSTSAMNNGLQILSKGKKVGDTRGFMNLRETKPHRENTITPPNWRYCNDCCCDLTAVSVKALAGIEIGESSRSGVQGYSYGGSASSLVGISPMDQSFVLLPKTKHTHKAGSVFPSSPQRGGKIPPGKSLGDIAQAKRPQSRSPAAPRKNRNFGVVGHDGHGIRALDESFVVLPSSAASIYSPFSCGTAVTSTNAQHTNSASFYCHVTVKEKCMEIASTKRQVEQMICLDCAKILTEEINEELEEAKEDIEVYETCLGDLQIHRYEALSEKDFAREKLEIEEEERMLEAQISEVEKQRKEIQVQLLDLQLGYEEFEKREERFCEELNDFTFQVTEKKEEVDALDASLEVASVQLESLKRMNVLDDALHIWVEGDFGTINNFRLGRLPNIPVEWEEINAAWGQACFLLHTLAQYCHMKLPYQILPMGSRPRISCHKNSYELFGPVNLYWSSRYDKAITLFLACLKELAEFATTNDVARNVQIQKRFKLPYKIETSKVGGFQCAQSFNNQKTWTKALKCTLLNLCELQAWVTNSPFYGNLDSV